MKQLFLSLGFLCSFLYTFAQPTACTPIPGVSGETCLSPCWHCLNPYVGTTSGFLPMGATLNNFCGKNVSLQNDQYLAFKPLCSGVGTTTFTITSPEWCTIQAAIYKADGCGTLPYQCNPGFSGKLSNFGNVVNYDDKTFYVLMIDGINTQACTFSIQVNELACIDTSACFKMPPTANREMDQSDALKVFPNPTDGSVQLSCAQGFDAVQLRFWNVQGKIVAQFDRQSGTNLTIDLVHLPRGLYYLQVIDAKRQHWTQVVRE